MEKPPPHDAGEAALVWMSSMLATIKTDKNLSLGDTSVKTYLEMYMEKIGKGKVMEIASKAWTFSAQQNDLIRTLKRSNEKLSALVIENQEDIIRMKNITKTKELGTSGLKEIMWQSKSESDADPLNLEGSAIEVLERKDEKPRIEISMVRKRTGVKNYRGGYVCPVRSADQRREHRLLVAELKKKSEEEIPK